MFASKSLNSSLSPPYAGIMRYKKAMLQARALRARTSHVTSFAAEEARVHQQTDQYSFKHSCLYRVLVVAVETTGVGLVSASVSSCRNCHCYRSKTPAVCVLVRRNLLLKPLRRRAPTWLSFLESSSGFFLPV